MACAVVAFGFVLSLLVTFPGLQAGALFWFLRQLARLRLLWQFLFAHGFLNWLLKKFDFEKILLKTCCLPTNKTLFASLPVAAAFFSAGAVAASGFFSLCAFGAGAAAFFFFVAIGLFFTSSKCKYCSSNCSQTATNQKHSFCTHAFTYVPCWIIHCSAFISTLLQILPC